MGAQGLAGGCSVSKAAHGCLGETSSPRGALIPDRGLRALG